MRIALFVTCLVENFLPRSALAVARVLEHLGHEVVYPPGQTCCGQVMFNNGFHAEALALARRMCEVFGEFEWVVTPSASCAAMVRENMSELGKKSSPEDEQQIAGLAGKTFEFIEFLDQVLRVRPEELEGRWTGRATYHPSCHLRSLGQDSCESFLRALKGLEFRPMDKADQCCGFGGTFAIKYPKISGSMVMEKVASLRRSGADMLVSNDAGCSMSLLGACRRQGLDIRCSSYAELLAEGLGLMAVEEDLR